MNNFKNLCEQEKVVLGMLCSHSRKEIAEILKISLHSVNSFVTKLERLGFYSEIRYILKNIRKS